MQPGDAIRLRQSVTGDLLDQPMDFDRFVSIIGPSQQRVFGQIGDSSFDIDRLLVFGRRKLVNHRPRNRIGGQPAEDIQQTTTVLGKSIETGLPSGRDTGRVFHLQWVMPFQNFGFLLLPTLQIALKTDTMLNDERTGLFQG